MSNTKNKKAEEIGYEDIETITDSNAPVSEEKEEVTDIEKEVQEIVTNDTIETLKEIADTLSKIKDEGDKEEVVEEDVIVEDETKEASKKETVSYPSIEDKMVFASKLENLKMASKEKREMNLKKIAAMGLTSRDMKIVESFLNAFEKVASSLEDQKAKLESKQAELVKKVSEKASSVELLNAKIVKLTKENADLLVENFGFYAKEAKRKEAELKAEKIQKTRQVAKEALAKFQARKAEKQSSSLSEKNKKAAEELKAKKEAEEIRDSIKLTPKILGKLEKIEELYKQESLKQEITELSNLLRKNIKPIEKNKKEIQNSIKEVIQKEGEEEVKLLRKKRLIKKGHNYCPKTFNRKVKND